MGAANGPDLTRRAVLGGATAITAVATLGRPARADDIPAPLAHWSFDADRPGRIVDITGHGWDGVPHGPVSHVRGRHADAVRLPENAYIGFDAALLTGASAFTLACWVRPAHDWTQYRAAIGLGTGDMSLSLTPRSQNLTPGVQLPGVELRSYARTGSGEWHHLAVTYSGGLMLLYFDGREAGRLPGDLALSTIAGGMGFLGAAPGANGPERFLDGDLDEVVIYGTALSAGQIGSSAGGVAKPPGATMPKYPPIRMTSADTWRAVDSLGRILPGHAEVGDRRPGKYVGAFYFLWEPNEGPVYDITKIRAEAERTGQPPEWGPEGHFHYWGEPYFGYYRREDPWIIRRHALMLAAAGVDVLIFDATNDFTYDAVVIRIAETLRDMRMQGIEVPRIAFFTNPDADRSAAVVDRLYRYFYQPGLFADLWFHWLGKPLIIGNVANVPAEQRDFFSWRLSWAWHPADGWFGDGHDAWPWIDDTPQAYGWHDNPQTPEETCVGIGGHPTRVLGRSYHDGAEPSDPTTVDGQYVAEQWRRALEVDPDFVWITGWNEWIAQRFIVAAGTAPAPYADTTIGPGDTYFVDLYSEEFSRDGELMRGGYGDNYYLQLVGGIRRFKGVSADPPPVPYRQVHHGLRGWARVPESYLDDLGDTTPRNFPGPPGHSYSERSGRNEIIEAKVAHTASTLSFWVRTGRPLRGEHDRDWMVLYLGLGDPGAGWCGFDWAVNRTRSPGGWSSVDRWNGTGWQSVGHATHEMRGSQLAIHISRDVIGCATGPVSVRFSWADNVDAESDPLRFYDKGDTAPAGRCAYFWQGV